MMICWSLLAALFAQQDPAPFGFSGIELYKVSDDTTGLVTGDFNGDGRGDFAVANNARTRIELFLQKTPEKMAADAAKPPHYDEANELHDDARFEKVLIPNECKIHALVAGDFDGDKTLEFAYHGDPPALVILKRKGDKWEKVQEFKTKQAVQTAESLLAADLNGDGRTDLALLTTDGVSFFLQNKDGKFDAPVLHASGLDQPTGLALARPKEGNAALVVYRTNADNGIAVRPIVGTTLGPEWIFPGGKLQTIFVPRGDAELSLVTVSATSGRLARSVVRTKTNSDALFETPAALYPLPGEKGADRGLAFGDLNGDGLVDAVVAAPTGATLDVYLQTAEGFFRAPLTSSTFAGTTSLQVGDFDGDGRADVLVASPEERVVGLATWEKDHLAFPKSIGAFAGKPYAALAAPLLTQGKTDLAVVTEDGGTYSLKIIPGFSGDPIEMPLKFVSENPSRLIPIDIDGDGDTDLAVITPRDPFGLVLNEGDGKFTPLSSDDFGGKWLLQGARSGSYARTTLKNGRQALLVAKKNIGRAVALDKGRKLEILEQYTGDKEANLVGLARAGEHVVLLDDKSSTIQVLSQKDGEWKPAQEIKLSAGRADRLELAPLKANAEPALVLLGAAGFQVLRRGQTETSLEPDWTYESAVKDADLAEVLQGDLNGDGRSDLIVTDIHKRALEILTLPAKKGEAAALGLRFEIFEEKSMGAPDRFLVRAMAVADLTGDGKDDLIFLHHDRVVLYPQE